MLRASIRRLVACVGFAMLLFAVAMAPAVKGQVRPEDHNAIPGDGKNDVPGIQAAINAAGDGGTVQFTNGATYELDLAGGYVTVSNRHDLTLDGNGATLLLRGFDPSAGTSTYPNAFFFDSCTDIHLHGFIVDMETLPFTQGLVTNKSDGVSFDVLIDPGCNTGTAQNPIVVETALTHYPLTHPIVPDVINGLPFDTWVDNRATDTSVTIPIVGTNLRRVAGLGTGGALMNSKIQFLQPNADRIALTHQKYGGGVFGFRDCVGVRVDSTTVYTVPGDPIFAHHHQGYFEVDDFHVLRKPGRVMSCTACPIHLSSVGGSIDITNCTLEGSGDDAIAIHGSYLQVKAPTTNQTLTLWEPVNPSNTEAYPYDIRIRSGDVLNVYNSTTAKLIGTITVAQGQSSYPYGDNNATTRDQFTIIMTANAFWLAKDMLVANTAWMPSSVNVDSCTIGKNRRLGMNLQVSNVNVTNCDFSWTTASAVNIATDSQVYYESAPGSTVLVESCSFGNVNRGAQSDAAGFFGAINVQQDMPFANHYRTFENVRIAYNSIDGTNNGGIYCQSAWLLSIEDNLFSDISAAPNAAFSQTNWVVYLHRCEEVNVDRNIASQPYQFFIQAGTASPVFNLTVFQSGNIGY